MRWRRRRRDGGEEGWRHVHGEVLSLRDFRDGNGVVRGWRFTNCTILDSRLAIGAGKFIATECSFACWGHGPILRVAPVGKTLYVAAGLSDVEFENCTFPDVVIYVTPATAQKMVEAGWPDPLEDEE